MKIKKITWFPAYDIYVPFVAVCLEDPPKSEGRGNVPFGIYDQAPGAHVFLWPSQGALHVMASRAVWEVGDRPSDCESSEEIQLRLEELFGGPS